MESCQSAASVYIYVCCVAHNVTRAIECSTQMCHRGQQQYQSSAIARHQQISKSQHVMQYLSLILWSAMTVVQVQVTKAC